MIKLTEGIVSQFRVQGDEKEAYLWDDLPGFGLRACATGKKSYLVHYRIGRQKQKVTLGAATCGRHTEMRKLAGEMLAKAKLGQDPSSGRREAFAKQAAAIGSLVERYIEERQLQLKPRASIMKPDILCHIDGDPSQKRTQSVLDHVIEGGLGDGEGEGSRVCCAPQARN